MKVPTYGNIRLTTPAVGVILYAGLAFFGLQPAAAQSGPSRMEITLERKEGTVWKAVDPALILASGDVIRFRFKSTFSGYLYVTDYGTSGQNTLLFPRVETGQKNLLESGKEYLIPATEAFFRVSGPPGYESVYWLISPVALGNTLDLTPARPSNYHPPLLLPRCDDTVLKARGLCLDAQAGPRVVDEKDKIPDELSTVKPAASRELTILQDHNQSVLSAPASTASAPFLYEFRLAHK